MARSKRKPSARAKATGSTAAPTQGDLEELSGEDAVTTYGKDTGTDGAADPDPVVADGADADEADAVSTKDPVRRKPSARSATKSTTATKGAAATKDKATKGAATTKGTKGAAGTKNTASTTSERDEELAEKAKDATRSRSPKKSAAAEAARTDRRRVAAVAPNPQWLAPLAVTLLIVGLVYLVTYYLSGGTLPLPIGDWNLLAGFGLGLVGGGLLMFWK